MIHKVATLSTRLLAICAVAVFCAPSAAAPFMAGVDISSLPVHQGRGAVYRDYGQTQTDDAIEIFNNHGVNYYRLRLFVDPQFQNNWSGGFDPFVAQDLDYTIALAQRVKQAGGKVLLDFHYSDTWADPGHQWKPEAWRSLSTLSELEQQVYNYTKQSIEAFKAANVTPDMVQIGNEIASGFLWNNEYVPTNQLSDATVGGANTGYPWTGGQNAAGFDRLATLLSAGVKGARDGAGTGQEPLIMIHHDQGANWNATSYYFNRLLPRLEANGADPDVLGYSYYPIYHSGGIPAVQQNLTNSVNAYGKPVVIVEAGFPARVSQFQENPPEVNLGFEISEAGQQAYLQALVDTLQALPNEMGMGVFWWYAEARPTSGLNVWKNGRFSLFDQSGNLNDAARVFEQFLLTPGDFNRDGFVDTADYTVWRDGFATGTYDENDYADWKSNFGAGGNGAGAPQSSVPEPAAIALLVATLLAGSLNRRSRD
jgi:arabinogalactan endo-1,4-beta-galactosidase